MLSEGYKDRALEVTEALKKKEELVVKHVQTMQQWRTDRDAAQVR